MTPLLSRYPDFLTKESLAKVAPILKDISVLHYPSERTQIQNLHDPKKVIIVIEKATIKEVLGLAERGYMQFVNKNRDDFSQELLFSALMIAKPSSFAGPSPMFLANFSPNTGPNEENHVSIPYTSNYEKQAILEKLNFFLMQDNKLISLKELCIQVADEMYMNSIFSAPVDETGKHIFQNLRRDQNISFPAGKSAKLFSCYSSSRVIVGCTDPYGSLRIQTLVSYMNAVFLNDQAKTKSEAAGGAGVGLKYMVENASLFYSFIKPGEFSFVACGFLLKGMKANLNENKNFHFIQL
jgi:hypothetical protein